MRAAARATVAVVPVSVPRAVPRTAPVALVPTRPERPAAPPEALTRLLRCLDAASARPSVESMAALRFTLTDVVDRLKAQGLTLDRLVAVFEGVVHEHAATWPVLRLHGGPAPTRDATGVHARLLTWCVQAYRDDAWW